jgi:hypothetical protein
MEQLDLFEVKKKKIKSKDKRKCKKCGIVKETSKDFHISMKSQYRVWYKKRCKICSNKDNIEATYIRKKNLHLYPSDNVCKMCKIKSPHPLNSDHCHIKETFRGWICRDCNLGLGLLGDNIKGVKMALRYLERSKNEH